MYLNIQHVYLLHLTIKSLTLSAQQTKTDTCTNSVDPDETSPNELICLIRIYTVILLLILIQTPICNNGCFQFQRWMSPFQNSGVWLKHPFATTDVSKFRDGRVYFKTEGYPFSPADRNRCCCVEVLRPSQPNGVMSSAVSLPNHTFTGQA